MGEMGGKREMGGKWGEMGGNWGGESGISRGGKWDKNGIKTHPA